MKINPITNPNILKSYQATKPLGPEKNMFPSGRDEVTFSEEAISFSKALAEARDAIELRTPEEKARITDIADAIKQGEYKVGSEEIADKILESVLRK